jgi:hypothetical protein
MATAIANPMLFAPPSSSAAGIISYLEEDNTYLKVVENRRYCSRMVPFRLPFPGLLFAYRNCPSHLLPHFQNYHLLSVQVRALKKLHQIVDVHWAEVCNSLSLIEELSEDPTFPAADLAAAVASKCFYHLQEYNDALRLALCAGQYLDISVKSEYVDTMLAKCIDEYKLQRKQQEADSSVVIDSRMEHIIEQMFKRCYRDACYEQVLWGGL